MDEQDCLGMHKTQFIVILELPVRTYHGKTNWCIPNSNRVNYQIPLESMSDIIVTGHGARSITGIETNLDPNIMTERQFSCIPGIGDRGASRIVAKRAERKRNAPNAVPFDSLDDVFDCIDVKEPELASKIMKVDR